MARYLSLLILLFLVLLLMLMLIPVLILMLMLMTMTMTMTITMLILLSMPWYGIIYSSLLASNQFKQQMYNIHFIMIGGTRQVDNDNLITPKSQIDLK